jgi:hypothetical protein
MAAIDNNIYSHYNGLTSSNTPSYKTHMTNFTEFFNSVQVITALTIIAIALYYLAFERHPHKR